MYTFSKETKAAPQNTSSKSMMASRSHTGQSQGLKSLSQGQRITANQALPSQEPSSPLDIVIDSELPDREQALALTLDRTVHLNPEALHLPRTEFNHLIAHECAHVDQQNLAGNPGTRTALEREANNVAASVTTGRPLRPQIPASPRTALYTERTVGTGAADQRTWVSRVDNLVRNRFRLTGVAGRMSTPGRVTFQDTTAFAQGFGGQSQNLLAEAFAEGWGGLVSRIQSFYNYYASPTFDRSNPLASAQQFVNAHSSRGFLYWNHHALDWTAYGLTGITSPSPYSRLQRVSGSPNRVNASLTHSVTRAQAQAAASRQPGVRYELTDAAYGFTWPANPQQATNVTFHKQVPLSQVTRRVSAADILAETFAGVTSGGARGSRRVRIQSTPGQPRQPATAGQAAIPAVRARPANVSTLVHEACHFYTHNNFNRFVDSVRSAGTSHRTLSTAGVSYTLRLAPALGEGFTEYFARMLMREQATILGPVGTGSYQSQHDAARLIISNMRPPSAAESAYFHGPSADIQKIRDGIQYVEQNPNTLRMLQSIGAAVRTLDSGGTTDIENALRGVSAPAQPTSPRRDRSRPRTLQDVQ